MRPNDVSRIREELEPPWNDVREQRVLGRVIEARKQKRLRARQRTIVGGAALALAAAVSIVVWNARHASTSTAPVAAGSGPTEQHLALADGSQAVLLRDAHVQIDEQSPTRVRLVQQSGTVRYEVRPDPAREFSVRARGALVRVRGTIFTVDLSHDAVDVRVERGKVEVADGDRRRDLVAGEALRVQASDDSTAPPTPSSVPTESPSSASSSTSNDDRAPSPDPSAMAAPTPAALLATADSARLSGRLGDAAAALQSLVQKYPRDPRVPAALFSLGRVERARGRSAASARAFERCLQAAPSGPLAEDALAEAAVSWASSGAAESAKADASKYLSRYPSGAHAPRMRSIVEP